MRGPKVDFTHILIVILLLSTFIIIFPVQNDNSEPEQIIHVSSIKTNIVTLSNAIQITHNNNFTDLGFPGTGIIGDPYIIEGLTITNSTQIAISIQDTTAYFVIQNNIINGVDQSQYGIYMRTVSNGKIINNTIRNSNKGIYLYDNSNDNFVENNELSNIKDIGIHINLLSTGNMIANNTISDSMKTFSGSGITIENSNSNMIANNSLFDLGAVVSGSVTKYAYGIETLSSNFLTITNNFIENVTQKGISVTGNSIKLSWNSVNNLYYGYKQGIYVSGDNNIIVDNTFDNAGNAIITEGSNIVISRNTVINSNTGVKVDCLLTVCTASDSTNITIEDNVFTGGGIAVYINGRTSNFSIANNQVSDSSNGIWVSTIYSLNKYASIIAGNIISQVSQIGIRVDDSSNLTIVNNTISNADNNGISIEGGTIFDGTTHHSENNTVIANYVSNSGLEGYCGYYYGCDGISVSNSRKNNISGNILVDNLGSGISIEFLASDNLFEKNEIRDNQQYGISIYGANNNTITDNLVFRNKLYGLFMENNYPNNEWQWTENNVIKNNDFVANNLGGTFQGSNNSRINIVENNFWNEWVAPDTNPVDGIVDNSYIFDNSGEDRLPLTTPANNWGFDLLAPFLEQPDDLSYQYQTTDNILSWYASDGNPATYQIYNQSVAFASGSWNVSSPITVNIDGLEFGSWNFTIQVWDIDGKSDVNTVFVTIIDDATPPIFYYYTSNVNYEIGDPANLTWFVQDANPGYVELYRNGTLVTNSTWTSYIVGGFGSFYYTPQANLSIGVYNLTTIFFDSFRNNLTHSRYITVERDTTAPVIYGQIIYGTSGAYYMEGFTDNFVTWTITDSNPGTYSIFLNDVLESAGPMLNKTQTIRYNIDGLSAGNYNYTIVVYDEFANTASYELIVTVEADTQGPLITTSLSYLLTMKEGETGKTLWWVVNDFNPDWYKIYKDAVEVESDTWVDGQNITYSLDGLTQGSYIFKIDIADKYGNINSMTITVNVEISSENPTTTTSTTTSTSDIQTSDTTATSKTEDTGGGSLPISINNILIALTMLGIITRLNKRRY